MDMEHGEMTPEKKMMKMKWKEIAAIRVLTAVIVIIFVFWCGFEFGSMRAEVGSHFGGSMMTRGGWGGGNVMYGESGTTVQPMIPYTGSTVTPAHPITPTGAVTN